jgi:hypothetical protein
MIDPELPEETPSVNARMLRQFAGLWLLVWSGLAAWQWSHGHSTRAMVLGAVALAFGPIGLVKPEAIRPVFIGLMALTRPIGIVMTRVVLAVAYYLLFTPLALVFRVIGRDALSLKRRTDARTYWAPRTGTQEPRRYLRQV